MSTAETLTERLATKTPGENQPLAASQPPRPYLGNAAELLLSRGLMKCGPGLRGLLQYQEQRWGLTPLSLGYHPSNRAWVWGWAECLEGWSAVGIRRWSQDFLECPHFTPRFRDPAEDG